MKEWFIDFFIRTTYQYCCVFKQIFLWLAITGFLGLAWGIQPNSDGFSESQIFWNSNLWAFFAVFLGDFEDFLERFKHDGI